MHRIYWACALISAVFFALGLIYNVMTPIFETPDEIQHFYYVRHVATGLGLPIQGEEGRDTWAQEGSQPPLYYVLGAGLIAGLDTSDTPDIMRYNPQANVGFPVYPGNKNRIIHTERERFPYRGTVLAVHLLRLFSLIWGAGTVFFTGLLGMEVLGRRDLALLASACVAFIPQFLFISSSVSNDSLITFLATLTLWLLARLLAGRAQLTTTYAALLGVTLSLATLTKLSGLALLPLTAIILGVKAWRERAWSTTLRATATMGLLWLAIAGWWFMRNRILYGDWTGLTAMLEIAGKRSTIPSWAEAWGEYRGLRYSFWALFGWFNILVPQLIYHVLDGITILGGLGLIVILIRRLRARRRVWTWPAGLLVLWCLLMGASLVRWSMLTLGSQGRLLFPALAAFGILLIRGLAELVPAAWRRPSLAGFAGGLFLFSALCPFLIIQPAYAYPARMTSSEVPAEARIEPLYYLDQRVRLLAYQVDKRDMRPGDSVTLTLYWECLQSIERDYNLFIKFLGRQGAVVASVDSYPGWGSYPTSLWVAGQVIQDTYQLSIQQGVQAPARLSMELGFYLREDKMALPVYNSAGEEVPGVIGSLRLIERELAAHAIPHPTRFLLGNEMALVGYALDQNEVAAGGEIRLALYWQARAQPARDYTVFVHLVDRNDRVWSQFDKPPLEGDYPTSLWHAGQVVKDEYTLDIDAGVPAGQYWIEVGMYQSDSGQRLPLVDDGGRVLDERILLVPLVISSPAR